MWVFIQQFKTAMKINKNVHKAHFHYRKIAQGKSSLEFANSGEDKITSSHWANKEKYPKVLICLLEFFYRSNDILHWKHTKKTAHWTITKPTPSSTTAKLDPDPGPESVKPYEKRVSCGVDPLQRHPERAHVIAKIKNFFFLNIPAPAKAMSPRNCKIILITGFGFVRTAHVIVKQVNNLSTTGSGCGH
jgi:hypothetical protein